MHTAAAMRIVARGLIKDDHEQSAVGGVEPRTSHQRAEIGFQPGVDVGEALTVRAVGNGGWTVVAIVVVVGNDE